jgi:hypothetical protein
MLRMKNNRFKRIIIIIIMSIKLMGGHLNITSKIIYDSDRKVSAKIVPQILANGKILYGRRLGSLLFMEFRTMEMSPSM